ncbi:MAG: inositol-3-phosphate synthase [Candidatus Methanomethylicaceae archaeon]
MGKIKVVVAGIGNCCSSFVQAINFYKNNDVGLIHRDVGGFHPSDIEVVGAIDIDSRKVGKDLSEAIFSEPNVTPKVCHVYDLGVKVVKGEVLDGADGVLKDLISIDDSPPVDVKRYLMDSGGEILLNLLPTGAHAASRFYAKASLESGYAFINCTPTKIATDPALADMFKREQLPVLGDDLMSQIGGTALHMGLLEFLKSRGVKVEKTYQLDIGGSMEAYGILEEGRREEKRGIKSETIRHVLPEDSKIATGTSDFVGFMGDRRTSYFYIEGKKCLGADVIVDIYFRTYDGPNGAGMLLDIIRGTKIALQRGLSGALISLSAYGFKNPPVRCPISESRQWFEEFLAGRRAL